MLFQHPGKQVRGRMLVEIGRKVADAEALPGAAGRSAPGSGLRCERPKLRFSPAAGVGELLFGSRGFGQKPERAAEIRSAVQTTGHFSPRCAPFHPIACTLQLVREHAQQAVGAGALKACFKHGDGTIGRVAHDMNQRQHRVRAGGVGVKLVGALGGSLGFVQLAVLEQRIGQRDLNAAVSATQAQYFAQVRDALLQASQHDAHRSEPFVGHDQTGRPR